MATKIAKATHTPGPWDLVDNRTEMRIQPQWNGRPGGVALTIGSTALSFRAPRQGSHRGEKMVYREFSDTDRANARLIAAAPDLLTVAQGAWHLCQSILSYRDGATDELVHEVSLALRTAIANAEG